MNILGWGGAIEKGLDLIDDAFTSKQEEAEDSRLLLTAKTDAKTKLLTAYHPFKVSQRILMLLFCVPFVALMMLGIVGILFGLVDIHRVNEAIDFANSMNLGITVSIIVAFYFGGGALESFKRK